MDRVPFERQPPETGDERRHILFVDDDADLRRLLVAAVDVSLFRVVIAEGVPAAALLLRRHPFDLTLCGHMSTALALVGCLETQAHKVVALLAQEVERGSETDLRMVHRPSDAYELRTTLDRLVAS